MYVRNYLKQMKRKLKHQGKHFSISYKKEDNVILKISMTKLCSNGKIFGSSLNLYLSTAFTTFLISTHFLTLIKINCPQELLSERYLQLDYWTHMQSIFYFEQSPLIFSRKTALLY